MTKSAAEVEREVEASRGELDRTVEALKDKMTPGQLFDEASRAMGGAGQHLFSKFVEQAKDNPMPLAVMGLGLAWLMTTTNRAHGDSRSAGDTSDPRSFAPGGDGGVSLSETMRQAGRKASDAVHSAQDKISDAMGSAGDAGKSAAHSVSSAAASAKSKAAEFGHGTQRGLMDLIQREPLLIGGLAVAVGAAIGSALPSTKVEDRMIGDTRDRLVDKSKELVQEGVQRAGELAEAAYSGAKAEVENLRASDTAENARGAPAST
jgi:hypothetical protein